MVGGSKQGTQPKEDRWVPTKCNMCFTRCGILAHVVDGVVVEIKGNPASGIGQGTTCGKAPAGIMQLYDPNRITKPMKRTNPNKGLDQDPGWVEISWEEAYDTVVEKAKEALAKNPTNGLAWSSLVANNQGLQKGLIMLPAIFGSATYVDADICGAGIHPTADLFSGTGNSGPDWENTKYLIQFGTQAGVATRHGTNMVVKKWAQSRRNGAKLVVFDPHLSANGDIADLWAPIRPGTDAAAALSIANVLVNELGIYDVEFLKKRTNAPSLVDDATKRVIRQPETNKALYMDSDGVAKPYDEAVDPVLEGAFEVGGKKCHTAFTLYREHVSTYTPEYQESITTVPAATIRRVAKEFGEAACIGMSVTIDGRTVPYRPAAADFFSGVSRHKHSSLNCLAVMQLNTLVGSNNAVGGIIGFAPACNGYTEDSTIRWRPTITEEDGLIEAFNIFFYNVKNSIYDDVKNLKWPEDAGMTSIMPMGIDPHFYYINQTNPDFYGIVEPSTMMLVFATNPIKWWGNHDEMIEMYKKYEFVVGVDLYMNDSSYFYDLFLPEASYLERFDVAPNLFLAHHTPGAMSIPWSVDISQPVVPARDGAPGWFDMLCEFADRMGTTPQLVGTLNYMFGIKPEYSCPYDQKLTAEAFDNAFFKSAVGEQYDLEWFKEHGCFTRERKGDEVYIWADGEPGRVPLYFDMFLDAKERIDAIVKEKGVYWETDDFQAFPSYKPCNEQSLDPNGEFDIMPIYWTDALNVDTWSMENPWINEQNEFDPRIYAIEFNAKTAAAKGLKSGDHVRLVSKEGISVDGRVVVSQGVHPECCAVVGGHWGAKSKYIPNAKGKGVPINHLMSGLDPKRMDHTSAAYDQCCRVKVEKI